MTSSAGCISLLALLTTQQQESVGVAVVRVAGLQVRCNLVCLLGELGSFVELLLGSDLPALFEYPCHFCWSFIGDPL